MDHFNNCLVHLISPSQIIYLQYVVSKSNQIENEYLFTKIIQLFVVFSIQAVLFVR